LTISRSLAATKGGLGHGQLDLKSVGPVPFTPEQKTAQFDELREKFLPLYEQRLTGLIDLTQSLGIQPVLITQPALWGHGIDSATGIDLDPISGFYWDRLELYNNVTRAVAGARGIPVIDLARDMPKDSTFFYDWFHFTRQGAAKVAEIVATGLEPLLGEKYPQFKRN
jgi:lysophospholipase L1-like esterase